MPELPEVETLRRDLAARIVGRTITDFELLPGAERLLRGVPPRALRDRLCGAPITEIGRHGKYLLIGLGDGPLLVVHLRMTGSLRHRPAAAPPDDFLRARLALDDGSELRFIDVRKFGTLDLVDDPAEALAKLGPDAIDPAFDSDALWSGLRGRRAPVKSMLLDQRFVAGIGNIYADEALFLARLHPRGARRRAPSRRAPRLARRDRPCPPGRDRQPWRILSRLHRRRRRGGQPAILRARLPPNRRALRRLWRDHPPQRRRRARVALVSALPAAGADAPPRQVHPTAPGRPLGARRLPRTRVRRRC